jgi:transcriptional regulator with XRE-family HTH domain
LQQTVEAVERQTGVKIDQASLQQFETGQPELGRKKIDALIAFHDCASPQAMIEKGNAAALRHQVYDGEALGLAARYLREEAKLTQKQTVEAVKRKTGVKMLQVNLHKFETGKPGLGREKIDALIAFHDCASPREMIEKANRTEAYLFRDEAGKLQREPAGAAVATTLRSILERPFHRMEKLAAERSAQETPGGRGS